MSNKALGLVVPHERERMIGYGRYEDVRDALEALTQAAGPYLLGTRFTAADVHVGAHLAFGMQFGTIEKRPAFERYCARLDGQPARQRAIQMDDALMQ